MSENRRFQSSVPFQVIFRKTVPKRSSTNLYPISSNFPYKEFVKIIWKLTKRLEHYISVLEKKFNNLTVTTNLDVEQEELFLTG